MSRTHRLGVVTAALALAVVAVPAAGASTFGAGGTATVYTTSNVGAGQEFTVPPGERILRRFELDVAVPAGENVQIYEVLPAATVGEEDTVGPELWSGAPVPVGDGARPVVIEPDLPVQPGARYLVNAPQPMAPVGVAEEDYPGGEALVLPPGGRPFSFFYYGATDLIFRATTVALTAGDAPAAWPEQAVGTWGPARTVGFRNDTTVPLTPRRATTSGAAADDFLVTDDGCAGTTLAVGAGCTVTVRFAPQAGAAGDARTAELAVVSDDGGRSDVVALSGTVGALPAGPQGPQGPEGPAGPDGSAGDDGPAGDPGPTGDAGPTGAVGPAGDAGATGPPGPAGTVGAPGAVGPAGADGAKGETGAPGIAGVPGPAGPLGLRGPRGRNGTTAVYRCVPRKGGDARCVVELSRSRATRTVSVRITRGGRTVADGSRVLGPRQRPRVVLVAKAAATPGTYRIRIRIRQEGERTQTLTSTFRAAAR
jgi:hypothetical protein